MSEVKRTPGPTAITKLVCDGCSALALKDWSFECEDDETDSGTEARCTETDKHIASYYSTGSRTPEWCPAIAKAAA